MVHDGIFEATILYLAFAGGIQNGENTVVLWVGEGSQAFVKNHEVLYMVTSLV